MPELSEFGIAGIAGIIAIIRAQPLQQNSATGTRTRVARVRAEYPNQLDYSGSDASIHQVPTTSVSLGQVFLSPAVQLDAG